MLIEKVIKSLSQHKVQYALVGGYAVALHGAVRGTVDIDFIIALNQRSFRQTEKALNSIGLKSKLPIIADDVFNFREEYIEKRSLVAWSFTNPDNPLEIVDIIITEDAKQIKSVVKTFNGTRIKVIAIDDLIKMKKKSARKQDIEDIKALEKIK
jgi:predicted nucleotidyltransferase